MTDMTAPAGWTIRRVDDPDHPRTVVETGDGRRVTFFDNGSLRVFSRGMVPHTTYPTPHQDNGDPVGSSCHVVFFSDPRLTPASDSTEEPDLD